VTRISSLLQQFDGCSTHFRQVSEKTALVLFEQGDLPTYLKQSAVGQKKSRGIHRSLAVFNARQDWHSLTRAAKVLQHGVDAELVI
jgi:hypothetical protein